MACSGRAVYELQDERWWFTTSADEKRTEIGIFTDDGQWELTVGSVHEEGYALAPRDRFSCTGEACGVLRCAPSGSEVIRSSTKPVPRFVNRRSALLAKPFRSAVREHCGRAGGNPGVSCRYRGASGSSGTRRWWRSSWIGRVGRMRRSWPSPAWIRRGAARARVTSQMVLGGKGIFEK